MNARHFALALVTLFADLALSACAPDCHSQQTTASATVSNWTRNGGPPQALQQLYLDPPLFEDNMLSIRGSFDVIMDSKGLRVVCGLRGADALNRTGAFKLLDVCEGFSVSDQSTGMEWTAEAQIEGTISISGSAADGSAVINLPTTSLTNASSEQATLELVNLSLTWKTAVVTCGRNSWNT